MTESRSAEKCTTPLTGGPPGAEASTRGADGLTAAELRRGRDDWWKAGFTQALRDALPVGARRVVEVGCGLGRAGRELLPLVPGLTYVGLDVDAVRLATARQEFGAASLQGRADFAAADAGALPIADGAAECLLYCMTLQHVADPAAALHEAHRVLGRGGTLVAAEPDTLTERWFFDGPLEGVTEAFRALLRHGQSRRAHLDLAIGSRVPGLARAAGFEAVELSVHAIYESRHDTARACAERWREMALLIARACGVADSDPTVEACRAALGAWLAAGDLDRTGECGTTVPAFLTTGRRGGG